MANRSDREPENEKKKANEGKKDQQARRGGTGEGREKEGYMSRSNSDNF